MLLLGTSGMFQRDSYIEFRTEQAAIGDTQTVELNVRTVEGEGVLFWHGQPAGQSGRDADFVAIALVNGYVQFRSVSHMY